MSVNLFDRIEQHDWSILDPLQQLRVVLVRLDHDLSERHDRFEASWDLPEQLHSCLAIKLGGLATNASCELFRRQLVEVLEEHVVVVAAIRFLALDKHPLTEQLVTHLLIHCAEQALFTKPVGDIILTCLVALLVQPLCLLKEFVIDCVS